MAEQAKNAEELLKQVGDFESTLKSLEGNVSALKKRLEENKEKYGSDISKWPKE